MPEVAQATITVTPVLEGAQQTLTNELTSAATPAGAAAGAAAGQSMGESLGKGMSKVGSTLTKTVTAPIAGIAAGATLAWKEVDSGLDTIVKKTGASGDALEEMEGILGNLATSIPTDFETAGSAIGEVNTRFGVTGDELENLSGLFVKFAKLNDQDVSSSVDSVSKMMAAFGLEAEDAGKMLDALNVVGQQTGVDVGSLSDTVAANAKQFQEMGLSAEDAAAFVGSMSMAGVDSSTAMMGLKTAMKKATEDGKSLDEVLGDFEGTMNSNASESDKLAAAYEIFGSRAGAAIENAVSNGTVNLSDFSASLGDFEGSVNDTFAGTVGPMDEFQQTLNDLKLLGSDIVETAGPMLADILGTIGGGVQKVADAWNGLSPQMQQFVIKVAGIAAVAGPLIGIGGKVIGGVSKLAGGIGGLVGKIGGLGGAASSAAGPVASAAGSFGSMAGGALQLIAAAAGVWIMAQAIKTLSDAAINLSAAGGAAIATMFGMVGAIMGLMAVAAAVGPALTAGAVGIGVFGAAMLGIGEGINLACTGIAKVMDAVTRLVDVILTHAPEINSIVTTIGETVGNVVDHVSDGIVKIIDAISGGLQGVLDSIAGIFDSIGQAALNAGTGFDTLASAVIRLVKETGLGDLVATLAAVAKGVSSISEAASGAAEGAANLTAIANAFKTLGMTAMTVSVNMTMFGKTTTTALQSVSKAFKSMNLAKTMKSEMSATLSATKTGLSALRSAFAGVHFSFEQHIRIPHWSLSGSFNPETGSVPSVVTKWYRVAESSPYLFQNATLFGAGEANDEILYGRDRLMSDIREATGGRGMTTNITVNGTQNPEQYAQRLARELRRKMRMATA